MSEFIYKLLPTLLLFSVLCWKGIERVPVYSESFGDPANFLTLDFERAIAKPGTKFVARWTTDQGEFRVQGQKRVVNRDIQYVMELPEGRFVGSLKKQSRKCEPVLHYTVERQGALVRYGKLRGAFCF